MGANPEYQVAFITGAGNGIGRQLALTLADKGVSIAALDLKPETLPALEQEILAKKVRFAGVPGDVTDAIDLQKKAAELEAAIGPIDLLIANAGVGIETSALDYKAADMNTVLGVNLIGVSNTIAAVLPGMLQRRRGHLVAISSMASFRGLPRMLAYCASKAGVNSLMEGLRLEVADFNIKTTTICPGWIRTAMTAHLGSRLPNLLEVDDAARRMVNAIYRKKKFFAFPAGMAWQLRIINWFPDFVRDAIMRRMLKQLKRG